MPRTKKDPSPLPALVRSIKCAFCQKELNPATDDVTFIGVGKWRNGPGLFHAVCSAKTPDGQENPCFLNGMSWATNKVKQEPVCMNFEEWKARPVRRHASATRAANGRYELHLTESHLNCIFFLETKNAANADKAKEVVGRWQADWSLLSEDLPDIDHLERDARQADEAKRIQHFSQAKELPAEENVSFPEAFDKEFRSHSQRHLKHLLADMGNQGDDCKSCRISRGMKKLHAIQMWGLVINQTLGTMREAQASSLVGGFMKELRKIYDESMKSLNAALNLKSNDDKHNELARIRNNEDIQAFVELLKKHGIKT